MTTTTWYGEITATVSKKRRALHRFIVEDEVPLIQFPENLRKTERAGQFLYKGNTIRLSDEARLDVIYEKTLELRLVRQSRRGNVIELEEVSTSRVRGRRLFFRIADDPVVAETRLMRALFLMGKG